MEKFYVAHALILDDDNRFVSEVFCGLFRNRQNAYANIKNIMSNSPNARYIPQVRVGEVLDDGDDISPLDAMPFLKD